MAGAALALPAACIAPGQQADGAARFPAAEARAGCTQEDLPALVIRLTDAAHPDIALLIEVAGMPEALSAPKRIILSPLRRAGARQAVLARASLVRGSATEWLSGAVTVRRIVPGTRVTGNYAMTDARGETLAGSFDAPWQPGRADCG